MLHPALRALFVDLEGAGLRWSLLRVPSVPEAPTGDVDLLVDPSHLRRLREVLRRHGFVPVPGWQRPPTLLFVGYDEASARCLLLDVTDEASYGSGLAFRTGLREGLLARSRWTGEMRVLDDGDAFWALLLHCLLDKGRVPEHYRERLAQGADAASGAEVPRHLAWAADRLRTLAAARDWAALEAAAPEVEETWRAELSPRERVRPTAAEAWRRLRAPLLLRRRYGVSVALLGPNGAGKSTLADGIAQVWPFPVRQVYMGLWKSGGSAGSEIPVLSQLLRPLTAWARYVTAVLAQLRGQLVVFDRYVHDARRPPAPPFASLKRIYLWGLAHTIPPPDLLLLLDVPGSVSYGRKDENSLAEADRERQEFRALAEQLPQIHVLDATRSAEQVRADALRLIWERTQRRWRTGAQPAPPLPGPAA